METKKKITWGHPLVVILLLIAFYPVGLFLMWRCTKWHMIPKVIITAFFVMVTIGILSPSKGQKSFQKGMESAAVKQETSPSKITVTSQIIKKVDKKYRYFFDIRNTGTEDFTGKVTINLFNNTYKSPLVTDTFDAASAYIAPEVGKAVYMDANSGPVSEHGDAGLTKFTYTITINGKEVGKGEGQLTDKFENTNY